MAIKPIQIVPDPVLRKIAEPVEIITDETKQMLDDMAQTMYDAPGIGLAAIQVGVPKRVIVIDLSRDDQKKNPLYFVNPEIVVNSDNNAIYEEGCLSVPGQFAEIKRPNKCQVKYLDYRGNEKILDAEGLLATCIQHEIDHLEGILFIDYLSKLKKSMIIKKLSKQKKSIERIVV